VDAGAVYVDVVEDGVLGVDDGEGPKVELISNHLHHDKVSVSSLKTVGGVKCGEGDTNHI
jgi:hypothetical protein